MSELAETIQQTVLKIARRRQPSLAAVTPAQTLIGELGLESLDIAELVATLELATGRDPFSRDVAIVSVKTVGDLLGAYGAR